VSQLLDRTPLYVDGSFMAELDWTSLKRKKKLRAVMIELEKRLLTWEHSPTRPLPDDQCLAPTAQVAGDGNIVSTSIASRMHLPMGLPLSTASIKEQVVLGGPVPVLRRAFLSKD
jgi:hypothetical protein